MHLASQNHADEKKNPKNIFVCTDKLKHAHMHMIPKPHKT